MPKNAVTDPITDQEMAFAQLILSGTMTDRRAAEAVGLNPDTAAYTKAKPHVRAYMVEHRAAVEEKLVQQEAEGLRTLNLGRDQILARLWALANLSPEATRNNIAGQIKALAMIVAIEGLSLDRSQRANVPQPAASPVTAQTHHAERPRGQHLQAEGALPGHSTAPAPSAAPQAFKREAPPEPASKPAHGPASFNLQNNHSTVANPFIHSESLNPFPPATELVYDAVSNQINSLRLPILSQNGHSAGRMGTR